MTLKLTTICACGNTKPKNQLWCDECHAAPTGTGIGIYVPPNYNPQEVIAEHMAFHDKSPGEQAGIIQREREGKGFKV